MTFNEFEAKIPERDIWDNLKKINKPIVMYGMGNGADKICSVLDTFGIQVADFFASDGFVRGQTFHQKTVKRYSEICSEYRDFVILVSFGSRLESVISYINDLSKTRELYLPDVPVAGKEIFSKDFYVQNRCIAEAAFNILQDDLSKEIFSDVIMYKLTGEIRYLLRNTEETTASMQKLFSPENWVSCVDLGAYSGDSIRQMLSVGKNIKNIYAFEPDAKNFSKLVKFSDTLKVCVNAYNLCAWDKKCELEFARSGNRNSTVANIYHTPSAGDTQKLIVKADTVDNIVEKERVDFIKFDVEGAEKNALDGAVRTLKANSPDVLMSAYHRSGDIFDLLLEIHKILPEHKLYLRRNRCLPAWEINVLASKT